MDKRVREREFFNNIHFIYIFECISSDYSYHSQKPSTYTKIKI